MTTTDTTTPAPTTPPAPEPVFAFEGKFKIYITPDDSAVIAFQHANSTEQGQHIIPGYALATAAAMLHTTPAEMIAKLTGALQ